MFIPLCKRSLKHALTDTKMCTDWYGIIRFYTISWFIQIYTSARIRIMTIRIIHGLSLSPCIVPQYTRKNHSYKLATRSPFRADIQMHGLICQILTLIKTLKKHWFLKGFRKVVDAWDLSAIGAGGGILHPWNHRDFKKITSSPKCCWYQKKWTIP